MFYKCSSPAPDFCVHQINLYNMSNLKVPVSDICNLGLDLSPFTRIWSNQYSNTHSKCWLINIQIFIVSLPQSIFQYLQWADWTAFSMECWKPDIKVSARVAKELVWLQKLYNIFYIIILLQGQSCRFS